MLPLSLWIALAPLRAPELHCAESEMAGWTHHTVATEQSTSSHQTTTFTLFWRSWRSRTRTCFKAQLSPSRRTTLTLEERALRDRFRLTTPTRS